MKLFISHASKNANYGNALVDLLIAVGINSNDIVFTSNDAFGIPIGQNIFNWLKSTINEKPYVLYLLSSEYYQSVACLNEMGAAWIIESDHTMIFTPHFNLRSYDFQNGALDPREIGFYINNENKVLAFIESLKKSFNIPNNPVLINQRIKYFISIIDRLPSTEPDNTNQAHTSNEKQPSIPEIEIQQITEKKLPESPLNITSSIMLRFHADLVNGKLKDEEMLLAKYIIDTDRFNLGTGWQESNEISNIRIWEDIHELTTKLSNNYNGTLKRFEMKKLTEVSAFTSQGNPKEVILVENFRNELLYPKEEIIEKLKEVMERNKRDTFLEF